jgi:hypothetical protein
MEPLWSPSGRNRWQLEPGRRVRASRLEASAGGGEVDVLCRDPRTLELGALARGSFAALAAKLRPALVIYAHDNQTTQVKLWEHPSPVTQRLRVAVRVAVAVHSPPDPTPI